MACNVRVFTSGILLIIIRGPPSFGFFSSRRAGKNVMRIRMGVATINIAMIEVRFGIITIFEMI